MLLLISTWCWFYVTTKLKTLKETSNHPLKNSLEKSFKAQKKNFPKWVARNFSQDSLKLIFSNCHLYKIYVNNTNQKNWGQEHRCATNWKSLEPTTNKFYRETLIVGFLCIQSSKKIKGRNGLAGHYVFVRTIWKSSSLINLKACIFIFGIVIKYGKLVIKEKIGLHAFI